MFYKMILGFYQVDRVGREFRLLIVPIFMLLGGIIAIYSATKKGVIVKVTFMDGNKTFRIKKNEVEHSY